MRDDIEFNIEFCELIEQYPNIYDYTKTGYSNRNVQDKIWQEIAIKVGATAQECKERWKNIRCSYSKNKKRLDLPSGSGAKTIKEYYLSPHLHFLDNYLKSRPTKSNLSKYDCTDGNDSEEVDETLFTGQLASENTNSDSISNQSTPTPPLLPLLNKSRAISIKDVNKSAHEYFSQRALQMKTIHRAEPETDSDLAFFQSMLPDMKSMTPAQKRRFKMGVLNLSEQILNDPVPSYPRTQPYYPRTPSRETDYDPNEGATQQTLTSRANTSPAPSFTSTQQTAKHTAAANKNPETQLTLISGEYINPAPPAAVAVIEQIAGPSRHRTYDEKAYYQLSISEYQQTRTPGAYERAQSLAPPATPTTLCLPIFSPITPATPHPNPETSIQSHEDEISDFNENYPMP
ncbi:hypothetical protein HF086_009779 [Spodoptera exigua]|uniref:Transcription factor Adf-1 n=2 Tax=Spodoptera exigua TaxID=7107 RepID=A0A922MWG2_SPOEX|nr:hypothetical protein HF086_009779 [Spodoptera exigua]